MTDTQYTASNSQPHAHSGNFRKEYRYEIRLDLLGYHNSLGFVNKGMCFVFDVDASGDGFVLVIWILHGPICGPKSQQVQQ